MVTMLSKSPMNYLGNKYKVLPQMLALFPTKINNFYDCFCGGLDVSLNITADSVHANDKHEDLIWLYDEVVKANSNKLGDDLLELDNKYFPMNTFQNKALRSWDNDKTKMVYINLFNKKNSRIINLEIISITETLILNYYFC